MKKGSYYSMFLFLFFFLSACTNDRSIESDNAQIVNVNSANTQKNSLLSIGELHNQGLDVIYNDVINGLSNESISQVNTLVSGSSWNYSYNIYPINKDDETTLLDIHNSSYLGQYDTSNYSSELTIEINNLISYIDSKITSTNTNAGQEIYEHSRTLLANPPITLEGYELEAWKSAVDVMGYSAIYWYNNIESWEVKMENISTGKCGWLCRLWKNIKSIVVADAAGAASGFVTGFVKAGGSWQTAGAGALIGGTGASAGGAVKELFTD